MYSVKLMCAIQKYKKNVSYKNDLNSIIAANSYVNYPFVLKICDKSRYYALNKYITAFVTPLHPSKKNLIFHLLFTQTERKI